MSEILSTDDNLRIWWEAVLNGDTMAYSHVHELLHPVLYRYAFAMLNDEALAGDVLRELFIKIWFRKEKIGVLQNVRAFFLTALRRQALNQLRSLRRLQILLPPNPTLNFLPKTLSLPPNSSRISGKSWPVTSTNSQNGKRKSSTCIIMKSFPTRKLPM
ncbi:RNA polymerase sigma factor [Chitinophaga sedimenti]|uniref:RNA polymerase sigma factor n=1 Tax=Chitinophaga sedimenti TaxID=2033606 RepID=UPI002005273D|nr:RNA polymerase sigma factor [Chitinophaga sedimenti]MCK7558088.1 RNA polymerase sigma factor [Chitinophaga sedimenti]